MTWRDAVRCAGLVLRGVLPRRGVRCPGLAWLPSVARRPGWRDRPALRSGSAGVAAWRGGSAGVGCPALGGGSAGVAVLGPGGGLRAYIRNPEGIATTARPLPPKKIFLSP